jgi:hypothetical protein
VPPSGVMLGVERISQNWLYSPEARPRGCGMHKCLAKMFFCFALVLLTFLHGVPVRAQTELIVPGIVTSQLVDQLAARATEGMERAEKTGDYVLAQAYRNVLTMLDAFRATSKELLDRMFQGLTAQQQNFFREADTLLVNVSKDSQSILEDSTKLVELVYQVSNDLPLVGRSRMVVLRYSPSNIIWERGRQVTIVVRGLNVQPGNPVLIVNGNQYLPVTTLMQEARFHLPTDIVAEPKKDPVTVQARIEFKKKGLISTTTYRQTIAFTILPRVVGTYSVGYDYSYDSTERSEVLRRDYRFEGRDTTVRVTQTPTKGAEWRIDPSTIKYLKYAGEASNPVTLDGPASPTGFTLAMRCNQYWRDLRQHPGYGDAYWTWQEFRPVSVNASFQSANARVRTGKAATFLLPYGTTSLAIVGKFEDNRGNTFMFGGSTSLPAVKVRRDGNFLVLSPTISQQSDARPGATQAATTLKEMWDDFEAEDFTSAEQIYDALEKAAAAQVPCASPTKDGQCVFVDDGQKGAFLGGVNVLRGLTAEMKNAAARNSHVEEASANTRLHIALAGVHLPWAGGSFHTVARRLLSLSP